MDRLAEMRIRQAISRRAKALKLREDEAALARNERQCSLANSGARLPFSGLQTKSPEETADDKVARWTLAVALFTAALVGTSVAGDIFAYHTLRAISGQLTEMRSGSRQMDEQIEINREVANVTKESMINSQRAWIAPLMAQVKGEIAFGKDAHIYLLSQNVGKEPATRYRFSNPIIRSGSVLDPESTTLSEKADFDAQVCLSKQLSPTDDVFYPSSNTQRTSDIKVDASYINEDLVAGKSELNITGCFDYLSQGKVRHSAYCFYYHSGQVSLPYLDFCSSGNRAD